MSTTPEQPSLDSASEFPPELLARFEGEFETYRDGKLTGSRDEHQKLVETGVITEEEMKEALTQEEHTFSQMDPTLRISQVLNNFHLWWPGGLKREFTDQKERREGETETITKARRLIFDLDASIHASGYDSIAEEIGKRGQERAGQLPRLARIYLDMRQKGYQRNELAQ